jgi:muramoyltetrapeptide carboxypeptidase
MIKQPQALKKGDKIAIVCPAKRLPKPIDFGIEVLKSWGLDVIIGNSVNASYHQFAGSDELRTCDIQHFLDEPDIKAIIAGRGGYGTIRIIDQLDFSAFINQPKWIIGFSDITVILSHLYAQFGIQSIHGQMPYTFPDSSTDALESLRQILFGEKPSYRYQSNYIGRSGTVEGELIGGNLSLLLAVEGSVSEMNYDEKILFIEDVSEQEYAIDRMMRSLKRKGKLKNLKALIVGAFNEISPEQIPFGQSPEELIWQLVKEYDYPVCFNFPSGHIPDNRAMVLGKTVSLTIENKHIELKYN